MKIRDKLSQKNRDKRVLVFALDIGIKLLVICQHESLGNRAVIAKKRRESVQNRACARCARS